MLCPSLAISWTVTRQAPLSMRFPRQKYWRGLPCPPPGDIPDPGIEPAFPVLQADPLPLSHLGRPMEDVHRLNANTMLFYIRKLSTLGVWYLQGILEPAPLQIGLYWPCKKNPGPNLNSATFWFYELGQVTSPKGLLICRMGNQEYLPLRLAARSKWDTLGRASLSIWYHPECFPSRQKRKAD